MSATSEDGISSWLPLHPETQVSANCLIEQTLCSPQPVDAAADGSAAWKPQWAKDFDYAKAVLDAWREEEEDSAHPWRTIWQPETVVYEDDAGTKLYGHLIGRLPETSGDDDDDDDNTSDNKDTKIPGVILCHTGAGPHDLFLLWKAASLVNKLCSSSHDDGNSSSSPGCLVLIADILSDESGWAWDPEDRTRYNKAREQVLKYSDADNAGLPQRPILRQRLQAAIDTLLQAKLPYLNENQGTSCCTVDPHRIAALGWCLGGHCIMELAGMSSSLSVADDSFSIRAMATFHGVFDNLPISAAANQDDEQPPKQEKNKPRFGTEVLICHGVEDPFVPGAALESALSRLQQESPRVTTSLLQLQGARHGFTNPAQDFHPNQEAFGYNEAAAQKAWKQTMNVLRRNLLVE